jgi:cold shock CspA family protein
LKKELKEDSPYIVSRRTMTTPTDEKRTTGIVKWFDSRGGFGFITILKGEENEGKDIFVHYSTLTTTNSQYKYLVLGEYVEFTIAKAENEKYEFFAQNVTGIRGGNLMCESRFEAKLSSLESRPLEEDRPKRTQRLDNDNVDRRPRGSSNRPRPPLDDRRSRPARSVEPSKRTYSSALA